MRNSLVFLSIAAVVTMSCAEMSRSTEFPPAPELSLQTLPAIGETVTITQPSRHHLMTSSSSTASEYRTTVDGIDYSLAVDDGGVVRFLTTSDPAFEIDGIRVGASVDDVAERYGLKPVTEAGFAHTLHLPSGWYAAVGTGTEPLKSDSTITWFYRNAR